MLDNKFSYPIRRMDVGKIFSKEEALSRIRNGSGMSVMLDIEKYKELDGEVAMALIRNGDGKGVLEESELFGDFELNKEVMLALSANEGFIIQVQDLEKFVGLDKEVAVRLMEKGFGHVVAKSPEKFSGLDQEIVLRLIELGNALSLVSNIEKLEGIDHKKFILKILEQDKILHSRSLMTLSDSIEKFTGLDKEVALALIRSGYANSILSHPEKFTGLDKEVFLLLIGYLMNNLEYEAMRFLGSILDRFTGLDSDVAFELVSKGWGSIVLEHKSAFKDLDLKEIEEFLNRKKAEDEQLSRMRLKRSQ